MLAILAKMNNRKFEAVYYHVRCLSSRNAFQSSKEGLVSIFEEMKRRWEATEKKRVEERKVEMLNMVLNTVTRVVDWIFDAF